MKKLLTLGILVMTALFFGTSVYSTEDLSAAAGKWKTIDDETGKTKSIVELYVAPNGKLQGKILQLLDPADKGKPCDKCPGDMKGVKGYELNAKVEGMTFVWGVEKLGQKSGNIFDPAKGTKYKVQIWREGANLKVRGYVAFFYRTQTWYPVK
jgi:uncharacterized protein (DUF2147 family)